MEPLAPAITVLLAGSVMLSGAAAAAESERRRAVRRAMGEDRPSGRADTPSSVSRWPARLLAGVGSTALARTLCPFDRIRQRYDLAGRPLTPEAITGIKALGSGVVAPMAFMAGFPLTVAVLLAAAMCFSCMRVPDIVLARMARRRQSRITDRVPDLVELVVATTEAGLTPMVAFRRSALSVSGPLGEELRLAVGHVDLGVPWRKAMEQLVERTDVTSLRRLCAALTRSHRLGAAVGSALRSLADDVRDERRARAEELARRAPVKMLFPLVFLILPAFLLLTVGPVVLATIRSLH